MNGAAITASEVERIVRDVFARLNGQAEAKGTATAEPAEPMRGADADSKETKTLELGDRVVTLDQLSNGRLNGMQTVVVGAKAIVTPAARDLLRERKIELTRKGEARKGIAQAAVGSGSARLTVGLAGTTYDAAPLLRTLAQDGIAVQQVARTGLVDVVDELADQVTKGGSCGLLLTGETAAALCLANRIRGVRSATAVDARSASAALRAIGANLLIVDPAGRSVLVLRQAVSVLCKGPRDCPALLRERLG